MRNRWLLNLALAVVITGLALLAVFKPGTERDKGEPAALTALGANEISSVRLRRPGQDEIVLQRDGDDWRLTAPVAARADRFRVDGLLQLLRVKSQGTLPAQDLARYGLDKPLAVLQFNDAEIRFGALHAFNDLQYALYRDQVHLVPAASFRQAAARWQDFLSTALLESHMKPVAFVFPRFRLTLKDGTWEVMPPNKELSGDRINTFVDEWRFARALSVTRQGAEPVTAKIRIDYVNEKAPDAARHPKTLEIGIVSTKPEVVLRRADEGLEYRFPSGTSGRMLELKPE